MISHYYVAISLSSGIPEFKFTESIWDWMGNNRVGWRDIRYYTISSCKLCRICIEEEDALMLEILLDGGIQGELVSELRGKWGAASIHDHQETNHVLSVNLLVWDDAMPPPTNEIQEGYTNGYWREEIITVNGMDLFGGVNEDRIRYGSFN